LYCLYLLPAVLPRSAGNGGDEFLLFAAVLLGRCHRRFTKSSEHGKETPELWEARALSRLQQWPVEMAFLSHQFI